jgi:hypothetical protein
MRNLLRLVIALILLYAPTGWTASLDQQIERVMGMKGQQMPGNVLRFTLTRTNLLVAIDAVRTFPNFALDGYAAFKEEGNSTLLVGELPLLQREVKGVVNALEAAHLTTTAIHNHLFFDSPRIIFVHFVGVGNGVALARVVQAALAQTSMPRTNDDNMQDRDDTIGRLDVNAITSIIGHSATVDITDHVLEYSIDRPEHFTLRGNLDFPSAMGPETEIHFQNWPGGRVAVAAELAVRVDEVDKVFDVLRARGAGTLYTALHNHWLDEQPRLFFIHLFAVGDAQRLAELMREILDQLRG